MASVVSASSFSFPMLLSTDENMLGSDLSLDAASYGTFLTRNSVEGNADATTNNNTVDARKVMALAD